MQSHNKIRNLISHNVLRARDKVLSRSIATDKEEKVFQVKEFNLEKTPITSMLWDRRKQLSQSNVDNVASAVSPPAMLVEKFTRDSALAIPYNFKTDAGLRDAYADARGSILLGKVFEDLDALAGNIAFLHVVGEDVKQHAQLPSLVTASVDKITVGNRKSIAHRDFILCGQVAWVGKSSLDIVMEIHDKDEVGKYNENFNAVIYDSIGSKSRILSSYYTFVARDRLSGKALMVNKLNPSTKAEIELFQEREALAASRRQKAEPRVESDEDMLVSLIERGNAIQDMPAIAHPNAVLIQSTTLENSFICQPQSGNTAGRVFGGYMMHRAYDLAMATCYTFAGVYPQFKQVDKVVFKRPVDIGDLVRLKSRIIYTSDNPLNPIAVVEVTCQIVRPEKAASFLSNTFNFEFTFSDNANLRRVLPVNHEEAIIMINASKSAHED